MPISASAPVASSQRIQPLLSLAFRTSINTTQVRAAPVCHCPTGHLVMYSVVQCLAHVDDLSLEQRSRLSRRPKGASDRRPANSRQALHGAPMALYVDAPKHALPQRAKGVAWLAASCWRWALGARRWWWPRPQEGKAGREARSEGRKRRNAYSGLLTLLRAARPHACTPVEHERHEP